MAHPNLIRLKSSVETATEDFLRRFPEGHADGLYDPIHYLMDLGGKRLRAVMALSSAEAEGAHFTEALPAALAVELFHNFTLMHDDIMDAAPLRRGQDTVHAKWNSNAAILSGDAMFTLAQMALSEMKSNELPRALQLFNQTSLEVCIGQQSDMAFETRNDVTIDSYLEMIRLKTSVLVAASLALGAISAGASEERVAIWYRLGEQLGLAFQMQDDLLDAFGDAATGKQIGGDILANKKTFLRLHTWAQMDKQSRAEFTAWDAIKDRPQEKIAYVKSAMVAAGADVEARQRMLGHVDSAMKSLDALNLDGQHRDWMKYIGDLVTERVA